MYYYLKKSAIIYVFLIMTAITAVAIVTITQSKPLQLVLSIVNLALFSMMIVAVFYHEGTESMQITYKNDSIRRQIIATGEDLKVDKASEYSLYKGFTFGLSGAGLLIVLIVVHVIVVIATGGQTLTLGRIAGIVYLSFYEPVSVIIRMFIGDAVFSWWHYLRTLYTVPFMMTLTAIPYYLGAKKIRLQHEKIEEQQRFIHGDKK